MKKRKTERILRRKRLIILTISLSTTNQRGSTDWNTKILLINWIIYNSVKILFSLIFSDNEKPTHNLQLYASHNIYTENLWFSHTRKKKCLFRKVIGKILFYTFYATPEKPISSDNKSNILWIIQTNEDIWEAKFMTNAIRGWDRVYFNKYMI